MWNNFWGWVVFTELCGVLFSLPTPVNPVISLKSGRRVYKFKKCFQCSPERWLRSLQTAAEVHCSLFRCVFIQSLVFFLNKIAAGKQKKFKFRLFPGSFTHIFYIGQCVFRIPEREKFFVSQKYPEWLWVAPSILFYGYWGYFLGAKRMGRDVKRSPPSSAELKNEYCPTYIHGMQTVKLTHLT